MIRDQVVSNSMLPLLKAAEQAAFFRSQKA